jgi:peptide/nickel transport system ATP-binding protein/oligopeptide transport system ATP-binding protein
MESKENLLEVKNLSVDFRMDRKTVLHAVRNVSFTLEKGETLGLVGESGCGKSVSCMSILQLNPPQRTLYPTGEILFDGKDLLKMNQKQLRPIRGNEIAMVFQEPMTAMNPLFTIGDQLMEALRVHDHKISKADAYDQSIEAVRRVKIPNPERILNSYPFALSGGMRQRVMIAMAMIARPKLLICDEPTTALDVTIQAQVLDLMNELKAETGMSIIFVTHDLGVISEMADRVLIMYGGRVCEEANVDELFTQPRHPYTIGLIDSHPNPDYHGDRLKVIPGSVPTLKDMPAGCPFHNRCAYAQDRCRDVFPDKESVNAGHSVSCHCWKQTPEGEVE